MKKDLRTWWEKENPQALLAACFIGLSVIELVCGKIVFIEKIDAFISEQLWAELEGLA